MFLLRAALVVVVVGSAGFSPYLLTGCAARNTQYAMRNTQGDTREAATQPSDLQRFEYVQLHMGVAARIVLYAKDEPSAEDAARAAFHRVAQLEDVASDYRSGSELMRLCRRAGQGPQKVSDDLFKLLAKSEVVSRASNGGFDITVGPLVSLWRQARRDGKLPTTRAIEEARKLVGWQNVKLDPAAQTADLLVPGMKLDLGGIAKGYAGDCAIAMLKEHGIRSALFEAGGDIVVSDPPPGKKGWVIDVEMQGLPDVTLANGAISTSGDTVQFVEIDGKHYSHVVDPHTGIGLTSRRIATVIAPDGITSDALSTAVTVMGDDGPAVLMKAFPGTKIEMKVLTEQK